jgi:adenylate cyclase
MATEIERKFLVSGTGWQAAAERSVSMRQCYLARTDAAAIRVRIVDDAKAYLTIKSAVPGSTRDEFEYEIPVEDARQLATLRTGVLLEKRRYYVPLGEAMWEVDVFEGAHEGLVIAEIELSDADAPFERPDWLGDEVTGVHRYYNAYLATHTNV